MIDGQRVCLGSANLFYQAIASYDDDYACFQSWRLARAFTHFFRQRSEGGWPSQVNGCTGYGITGSTGNGPSQVTGIKDALRKVDKNGGRDSGRLVLIVLLARDGSMSNVAHSRLVRVLSWPLPAAPA